MPQFAPLPQGPSASAGENCDQSRGLIATLLMALLAALFGRRRAVSPVWHPLGHPLGHPFGHPCGHPSPDAYDWDSEAPPAYAYVEYCGWHRDCQSPILYVIGPGPNRGMRRIPRRTPPIRPRIARAPPRAPAALC